MRKGRATPARSKLPLAVRGLQIGHGKRTLVQSGTASEEEAAALDTLAAAYAECARFEDAVATARRALALARNSQADGIKQRIQLYERRIPFHRKPAHAP